MSIGFSLTSDGKKSMPTPSARVSNCRIAAGRYTSAETTKTFFFCFSFRNLPSLATLVVLPAPCRPAISTTAGGCAARFSSVFTSPIAAISSLLTILTNSWPGVRLLLTSCPTALSFTRLMKSRTTGSATSASSNAMRTSRRVSLMFSSVSRPRPLILRRVRDNRSVKFSNIVSCST
ncbi:hypothetical protein D3C73_481930 [compost metagenome]